jgi:protein involved in polysaccharide export with SLBB domain
VVTVFPQASLLTDAVRHLRPQQLRYTDTVRVDTSSAGTPRAIVAARSADPLATAHDVIADGDRLKVTFFESLDVALDQSGISPDGVAAVFPRMDLSAEYTVSESGTLDLPKLGQFTTTGRTVPALQADLAAAFRRTIGRTSDVHVAIVDRQPIYVLGLVRNAGTFKHAPGLIVLQALAQAGGIDPAQADTSRGIESIRETERLRQTVDRLQRLLVTQARLIARRDNLDTLVLPESIKSTLSKATPHDALKALVDGEAATLIAERRAYEHQLSLAQRQVSIVRVEIEVQKMRVEQLKVVSAKKTERLRELEQIAARGSVPQYKLGEVSLDISEVASRQEDLRVGLAQAERRLVEAEILQAKIELDYSVGLEKELATTTQDIDDCTQAIASMKAVTQLLRNRLPSATSTSAGLPGLSITRRGPMGFTVIQATETTSLMPGDVVQVNYVDHTGASASSEGE